MGGTYNPVEHSCPVVAVTVNILAQQISIETPGTCKSGYSQYMGTVYGCGGEAEDVDCVPQGFMVPVNVYSAAPNCPTIPADLDFSSLPEAIAALGCTEPPVASSTFDWSAKTERCPDPLSQAPVPNGTWSISAGKSGLHWQGPLDDALTSLQAAASPHDPWPESSAPVALPLNPDLQLVYGSHGSLNAVSIRASVQTDWVSAGSSRRINLEGVLSSDGRFEVRSVWPGVGPDGRPCILELQSGYDGSTLTVMPEGAQEATAWLNDSADFERALTSCASWARLLMSWLNDPFALSVHASPDWQSADLGGPDRQVSRSTGATQQTLLLDLVNGGAPVRMERLINGLPYLRRDFGGTLEVTPGVSRPSSITESVLLGSTGMSKQVTLEIREVSALTTVSSAFGRLNPPEETWVVMP